MPPLALLALVFAVGIFLQETLAPPRWLMPAMLAATAVLLVWTWRRGRGWGLAVLANGLALGGVAVLCAWPRAPAGLLGGEAWVVVARVAESPERAYGQTHLLVELEHVARGDEAREVAGRVRLKLGGPPAEPLLPGDRVSFRARLKEPRGFVEPGAPDPGRRQAERGVIAVAGLPEVDSLVRLADEPARGHALMRQVSAWRARLAAHIAAHLDGDQRALVTSLVLGERGDVDEALDQAFRATGVTHVLSVSGLHLAIAAFLFFVGLRRVLVRIGPLARRVAVRRIAALWALPATLLYTLLTGAQVATVRACVVAWIWFLGAALERPPTAWAALGAAALVILGASPLALYDPSFQLSFVAAIGLVALTPRFLPRPATSPPARPGLLARLGRFLLGTAAASLGASLATAPLAAWHFAQAAPLGPAANLVVVPLAELWVLPVGLAASLVSTVAPRLAGPLWQLAGWGAGAMAAAVRYLAALPGVATLGVVRSPTWIEVLAWYGALAALAVAGWRRGWRIALIFIGIFVAAVAAHELHPRVFPSLTLTFLDVGQGDACLVELPDGRTLLVDGGGSFDPEFDPGEQVIVPWLERRGVRRVDIVVLTHPHPDHAGGLASVVERFPVSEIWTNGVDAELPALQRLLVAAEARGVPVLRPHALDGGGARVTVLHPLRDGQVGLPPRHWSENDGSIVLRLDYAGRSALLTGDIEKRAESILAASALDLHVDVLKAPHHGSRTSSTPPFVARVVPREVVYSVGAMNRWRFPAAEVDERWRAAGARTWRTDRDGAVTATIHASGQLTMDRARR